MEISKETLAEILSFIDAQAKPVLALGNMLPSEYAKGYADCMNVIKRGLDMRYGTGTYTEKEKGYINGQEI